jgi:hypothetical protein
MNGLMEATKLSLEKKHSLAGIGDASELISRIPAVSLRGASQFVTIH